MPTRTRIASQAFAGIAHTFAHLFVLLFATVVLVLEHEWGMTYDTLFALSIPMVVLFGAGALPAGWLGDRWSETGMLKLYFLGLGVCTVATGFADSPFTLALGLSGIGLFASIYHPVGIPWLIKHAPNRGRALGINGVFGSIGTAGAAVVAGALASWISWRAAFFVPGIACLATGIVFWLAIRANAIGAKLPEPASHARPPAGDVRRVFLVLAITVICSGMIYQVTSFALPKIFEERLSASLGDDVLGIAGMVTIAYLLSGLAQILGGEAADRYRLKTIYTLFLFLQIPVLVIAFALVHPALVVVSTIMVSLSVAGQPAENALLMRYTPEEWRGRAFGAKFLLTLGISALGVALIPIAYRITGSLGVLFLILAGFAAIAGFAALRLPSGDPSPRAAVRVPAE
jgi:MFS family permease